MTESRLQQECFTYHWNTYPSQRGLFFRIKNEGTNKISGAMGKATGIIPGVADMCLLVGKWAYFIEFKTEKGRQSKQQKEWEEKVNNNGCGYSIIRDLNEFKSLLESLMQIKKLNNMLR